MKIEGRLSIGDLAKATEIKVVTIRYYEQIGLIPEPARTSGNYRSYSQEHVRRLRFIRRCRDLGFTLEEVRDLLHLSSQQDQKCSEVDRLTARHLSEIEEKIADLMRLAAELRRIKNCCLGDGLIADCRIIEALSPEAKISDVTPLRPSSRRARAASLSVPQTDSRSRRRTRSFPEPL